MSGKATAADRPTSEITEDLPDWFSNNGDYVEINWEASDPNDKEIVRIYFWACYYEGEGDCEGAETDVDGWELIKNHNIIPDEVDPDGVINIPIDDFLSKFDDKEGRYKVITCSVNENGIAEYGEENPSVSNGCSNRYKTENHETYFNSNKMKKFGFDKSAPEILIEIELYGNGPETISYTINDTAGIANFTLEYKEPEAELWTQIKKEDVNGEPSEYSGTYQFRYKHEITCIRDGCIEGSYGLRIKSTDVLEQESLWTNTNSIYDITSPVLEEFSVTEDGDDGWLKVNDVVSIQWDSDMTLDDIGNVGIKYCLWDNVLPGNNTWSWVGDLDDDGNTTSLTITSSLAEGFYYFYPVLSDLAGNPSSAQECKEDERLSLDKTKPVANLEPEINGKFAYNTGTTITLSISDSIELGDVVLRYSYESTFYDFKNYDLSGQIADEITEDFYFSEGAGVYQFFLEVDDKHPLTPTSEATMSLIYDIVAPESEIVFEGAEIASLGVDDLTNLDYYPIYCTTTDQDHEVDKVHLYFRYKERESHTFGNWSEEPTTIVYSVTEICRINFSSFTDGDGFYEFYTTAIDKAGNEEEKAGESELTIIRDSQSPEFELQYLESNAGEFLTFNFNTVYYKGENIGEGQYRINFTGSLTDSLTGINGTSGDSEQEWSLDGSVLSISYDFNTSKADEDQTITLTISDLAGNLAEISINFEEDNYAPTFTLYNSVLQKSIHDETLLVRSDETTILITVFNNGSSISSYQLKFDDSEWTDLDPSNPSFSIPSGKDVVSLRVSDSLGNSISQNFTVEYDDEGPEFEPLNPDNVWYSDGNNTYVNGTFKIELRASDTSSGLDRIEYRYDDGEWLRYVQPLNPFKESDALNMGFSYRAIDKLGNVKEHQVTFFIDNTTTSIDFSVLEFTLVANSGNASENKDWNGTEKIDYNSFSTLKIEIANISDEGGSGISKIEIEYSNDNETWTTYDNATGIELSSASIQIRVTVTDNVGNTEEYVVGKTIEVINVPVKEDPESENNLTIIALLIVAALVGTGVAYKYRQKQILDLENGNIKTKPVEKGPPPIKCPKCSVLIPAESKSCAFCGTGWDDVGNAFLANPFADSKKQITKEIIPRKGEILIGDNLDRWKIETGARSSVGGRENNEDSISWNTFLRTTSDIPHSIRLGIVADGVGGHNKGEIASSLVISAINKSVSKSVNDPFHTEVFTSQEHVKILENAYHHGNEEVFDKAQNDEYRGMATTAVSVYLWEDENENNGFLIGNVGDSRGYLINREEIKQVTKDDSEVQKLIDEGLITDKEAKNHPRKNVITQAIGNKKTIKPRIESYNLRDSEFDCILLCSDGVSDKITDKEIHKIVNQFDNPQDACNKIVKIINRTNTNHDNVSLILIKFTNLFAGDY